jgi:hypothetical protein
MLTTATAVIAAGARLRHATVAQAAAAASSVSGP